MAVKAMRPYDRLDAEGKLKVKEAIRGFFSHLGMQMPDEDEFPRGKLPERPDGETRHAMVFDFLAGQSDWVSSEDMAKGLGCTIKEVQDAMRKLRQNGYEIVHGPGIRLNGHAAKTYALGRE